MNNVIQYASARRGTLVHLPLKPPEMPMPATNVVSFAQHKAKAAIKKQMAQPKVTQWDLDYEALGGMPAYQLHQVLQAMSVAYLTGDIRMGDKLLAVCRAEGFCSWVTLEREVGEFFLDADLCIAIHGLAEPMGSSSTPPPEVK